MFNNKIPNFLMIYNSQYSQIPPCFPVSCKIAFENISCENLCIQKIPHDSTIIPSTVSYRRTKILSINEKLPLTQEHICIFQYSELPSVQLSFFVVYNPMDRYYRKWCLSHVNARDPFTNKHQIFPLSSMGTCQVMVVPDCLSLSCSI